MTDTLVDSNVLLDVLTEDPKWGAWSASALARCGNEGALYINAVIHAEVSIGFDRIENAETALPQALFERLPIPPEAAFLAGKAFLGYHKRGCSRRSPLPDLFIGAHAAVVGLRLLTRDRARYGTYFPSLEIMTPTEAR
ncbi:MAG: type II toxin-antitoxin system VapC family toxin [Anaerolineae bacterium]|nr:type II toxin-antitoxin system VapC family toxin [Anaerolineae bacterium]